MNAQEQLFEDWLAAKSMETEANKARVALEEKIIASVGLHNKLGSKTHNIGEYKITIKTGESRKMDIEGAKATLETIPEDLRPLKKVVDEAGLKYLLEHEPTIYKRLSPYVTTTPSKTAVTILRKE